ASLPKPFTMALAVNLADKAKLNDIIRMTQAKDAREQLIKFFGQYRETPDAAEALLKSCGSPADVARMIEELRPAFTALGRAMEGPAREFETMWKQAESRYASSNPMFEVLLSPLRDLRSAEDQYRVMMALRDVAIGMVLDGREKA